MSKIMILDACAMIAMMNREVGGSKVVELYRQATQNEVSLYMHRLNLLEVYYDAYRSHGKERAMHFLNTTEASSLKIIYEITDDIFKVAGRLKATYKLSLADSIALATTNSLGGMLVTADHHELDIVEKNENIQIYWIR